VARSPSCTGGFLGRRSRFPIGIQSPIRMRQRQAFKPGKAYKDSKLCNMITTQAVATGRLAWKQDGIVFSSLYPGLPGRHTTIPQQLFRSVPDRILPLVPKERHRWLTSARSLCRGALPPQVVADPPLSPSPGPTGAG